MTTLANGMALDRDAFSASRGYHPTDETFDADPPQAAVAVADVSAPRKVPPRNVAPFLSREQILDATLECLLSDGYDGTTIRRIAKRLNCAVGSIYRYFTDKRQLLDAVTQRRFIAVAEWIESGASMREGFGAYAQVAMEQPELHRLMFWLHSVGAAKPKLPPIIERIIAAWAKQLGDARTAERLWAHLHGSIMLGRGAEHVMELDLPRRDWREAPAPSLEPVITRKTPVLPKRPVTQQLREDVTLL